MLEALLENARCNGQATGDSTHAKVTNGGLCGRSGEQVWLNVWRQRVGFFNLADENILPTIARMANLDTINAHVGNGLLCVPANSQYLLWFKDIDDCMEKSCAGVALERRVTAICHGFIRFMRVQRKDVPKKNWLGKSREHTPDSVGGALPHNRAFSGLLNGQAME